MKFKQLIASAVTAATGVLAAGQALAITPGDARFGNPDFTFYISGASATSKTVPKVLESFCSNAPGDRTVYVDDPNSSTASEGSNWTGVYCIMSAAAPGNLAGAEVLWMERFKGGSGWGPYPVDNNYYVEQLNIFRDGTGAPVCANADADSAIECSWENDRTALVGGECALGPGTGPGNVAASSPADSTLCVVPHGGVADVEAAIFADGAPSIPAAFPPQATFPNLQQNQGFGVVFQPIVTEDVYRNLQELQGLAVYATHPYDYVGQPTDWSLPAQPSMSTAEIRSMIRVGGVDRWSTLLNVASTQIGYSQLGLMGICRRTAGSGTQASYHIYFLDDPCGKNPLQNGSQEMRTHGNVGFIQTYENESSGGVTDCMDAMFDPATFAAPGSPLPWLMAQLACNPPKSSRTIVLPGQAPPMITGVSSRSMVTVPVKLIPSWSITLPPMARMISFSKTPSCGMPTTARVIA
jgi:hypothetical protein